MKKVLSPYFFVFIMFLAASCNKPVPTESITENKGRASSLSKTIINKNKNIRTNNVTYSARSGFIIGIWPRPSDRSNVVQLTKYRTNYGCCKIIAQPIESEIILFQNAGYSLDNISALWWDRGYFDDCIRYGITNIYVDEPDHIWCMSNEYRENTWLDNPMNDLNVALPYHPWNYQPACIQNAHNISVYENSGNIKITLGAIPWGPWSDIRPGANNPYDGSYPDPVNNYKRIREYLPWVDRFTLSGTDNLDTYFRDWKTLGGDKFSLVWAYPGSQNIDNLLNLAKNTYNIKEVWVYFGDDSFTEARLQEFCEAAVRAGWMTASITNDTDIN